MSDKNLPQTTNGGHSKAPLRAGGSPTAIIPQDIEQVYRLSQAIAAANMAPKAYNRDANAIMIGIMHGMEVGFTPMAALQSIAVINGMPTIWGDGAIGLVRGSGQLEEFSETIHGEGAGMEAVCTVRRRGQETEIIRRFSVDDAKAAGLWDKSGPWKQYPKRMLQMRARSWALRDGFADVLRGLQIREEVQDMGHLEPDADGVFRVAERPTRADFEEQRVDAEGDPIKPGVTLREHYVEKAAQRQEREMENDRRAAMGEAPLEDETEEPKEEQQTEPETPTEEPDADAETEQAVTEADQLEEYLEYMKGCFDTCETVEDLQGLWQGCTAHLGTLQVAEGSAWWKRFSSAYGLREKALKEARK